MNFRFPSFKSSRPLKATRPTFFRPYVDQLEKRDLLATFTVTSLADGAIGDVGTLRWAIDQSNTTAGPDVIDFNIGPSGGVKTIALNKALPDIIDTVTINGYTQKGAKVNNDPFETNAIINVEVTAAAGKSINIGLNFASTLAKTSKESVVRGLSIYGFGTAGIVVGAAAGDMAVNNVKIEGNFLGTDAKTNSKGNGLGVRVGNAAGVTIGGGAVADRNLISANTGAGIHLKTGSDNAVIRANLIGVERSGTGAQGNSAQGIFIDGANGVTIGGPQAEHRNVIGGNAGHGLDIFQGNNTLVRNNYIGVDVQGDDPVGNAGSGVVINRSDNTVVRDNVIGGNGTAAQERTGGITIGDPGAGGTSTGTLITGNRIGIGVDDSKIGNEHFGVGVYNGTKTTIGGTTAADRNVISGNLGHGVLESAGTKTVILGNFIGTNAAGTAAAGNAQNGVRILTTGSVTVGGTADEAGNVISGNAGDGLYSQSTNIVVQGNYIGVGVDGVTKIGNVRGIFLDNPKGGGTVTIGGAGDGARNVISGNSSYGIDLFGVSDGAVVQNNYIGTDFNGSGANLGNASNGVQINGGNNVQVIGNVISGNGSGGVNSDNATGTKVSGNTIGLNALGTLAVANKTYGVRIGSGSGSTVGGTTAADRNIISGNANVGVQIDGGSALIVGNYVGTDPAGNAAIGNGGYGVFVNGANQVTVGGIGNPSRNVISGNGQGGVRVAVTKAGVQILGNYIGVTAAGEFKAAVAGQPIGVFLDSAVGVTLGGTALGSGNVISGHINDGVRVESGNNNLIARNVIGLDADGAAAPNASGAGFGGLFINGASNITVGGTTGPGGDGNVISANKGAGVMITGSSNITLQNNYVGINQAGNGPVPGGLQNNGIVIDQAGGPSTNVTVGGTTELARNVISGNLQNGILVQNANTVSIVGNYIGTDKTGAAAVANVESGVRLNVGAAKVTIGAVNSGVGGSTADGRNVIAGNGVAGVRLNGGSALVQGNWIGTAASGNATLPNGTGVIIESGNNTVGGSTAGSGNLISGNNADGIFVTGLGQKNFIGKNYVGVNSAGGGTTFGNGGQAGIVLGGDGGNTVLDNIVSGNTGDGILVTSANNSIGASVGGNTTALVGLNAAGDTAIGNKANGIRVSGAAATDNLIGLLKVDGLFPEERRGMTISGNAGAGILIENGASNNRVLGNVIGTNAAITTSLSNTLGGVIVTGGGGNTIGRGSSNQFLVNVIAGHTNAAGVIVRGDAKSTVVSNGFYGSPTKALNLPNQTGVVVEGSASGTVVSGVNAGLFVSGNTLDGILVTGTPTGTFISAAYIGVQSDLTTANGNGRDGVRITGGSGAEVQSIIVNNGGNGIAVIGAGSSDTLIRAARIGTQGSKKEGNALAGILVQDSAGGVRIGQAGRFGNGHGSLIGGNLGAGVVIENSANVSMQSNYIGTQVGFPNDLANGAEGVRIEGSSGITVGGTNVVDELGRVTELNGNVISNSKGSGVLIDKASSAITVQGNIIGTNGAIFPIGAQKALPNTGDGITVTGGSGTVTIGGASPATGNIISGNAGNGVRIDATVNGVLVQGNVIGLGIGNPIAIPNGLDGVLVQGSGVTVGGQTTPAARNVISGNTGSGIHVNGAKANGTLIDGNFIGTDLAGGTKIGNGVDGVKIENANNVVVGVTRHFFSNVISGNTFFGVQISNSFGDVLVNNLIGVAASGKAALANQTGIGIDNSSKVTIGGVGGTVGIANVISGNAGDGIVLAQTDKVRVLGNFIGVNSFGTGNLGNGGNGVNVTGTSTDTFIGGAFATNYIAGNVGSGIEFAAQATTVNILSNYIGLDITRAKVPNNIGIRIFGSKATIGGVDLGNTIAGNKSHGIEVNGSTTVQTIVGNFIGTDNLDKTGIGNGGAGVYVFTATGAVVGSTAFGLGNVISGNAIGVHVEQSNNVAIQGNRIGTNGKGTAKLANVGDGVLVNGSSAVTVASNLISGNGAHGVHLVSASNNNIIQLNKIGTQADGVAALGNTGIGVFAEGASSKNTIGNFLGATDSGNTIAFNFKGVAIGKNLIDNAVQNSILGNSIFSNSPGLGIDLGNNGVTPNDNTDPDLGPNLLQNFPTLATAKLNAGNVVVTGTLNSLPNQTFRVEFFATPTGDPLGFGEGKLFLGFQDVTTDAAGNGAINVTLPGAGVAVNQVVTATATDQNGNTSEFSKFVTVAPQAPQSLPPTPPQTPKFRTTLTPAVSYIRNASGQVIGYRRNLVLTNISGAPLRGQHLITVAGLPAPRRLQRAAIRAPFLTAVRSRNQFLIAFGSSGLPAGARVIITLTVLL